MDQNSSGLSMMFGCAPEVWQDIMSEYHAFSERIGREVSLRPMTEDHLKDLVDSYLDLAAGEAVSVSDVFEEDSLQLILQSSQGNVRQALSICSYTVDDAAERGRANIDPELIQEVVS
jgi:type II secretory pathway predicted ATPase ExeA